MKSFKAGDRVRIVGARYSHTKSNIGKEGTIVHYFGYINQGEYCVEVDGVRPLVDGFTFFTAPPELLEPIVNPDETAWNEFRRYLQPDPAIILAKEPA